MGDESGASAAMARSLTKNSSREQEFRAEVRRNLGESIEAAVEFGGGC